jgi:hypothetical protein
MHLYVLYTEIDNCTCFEVRTRIRIRIYRNKDKHDHSDFLSYKNLSHHFRL